MGSITVNKLGGLSLILGPVIALVFYFIQPGGMIIDAADPADVQASIQAFVANRAMAHLTAFIIPIGLIGILYGAAVIQMSIRDGGSADAVSRYGIQLIMIGTIAWVIGSGMWHIMASDAGQSAEAVYKVGQGLNIAGSLTFALGFILFSFALSTKDEFNKTAAIIVGIVAIVSLVATIIGTTDSGQLETMTMISGLCYIVFTVWGIMLGLDLMNKE